MLQIGLATMQTELNTKIDGMNTFRIMYCAAMRVMKVEKYI